MDYNKLALQGFDITDMEFIQQFNLNPALANTPQINFAMLDNVYAKNIEGFTKRGMSETKAKVEAGRQRADAKKQIMDLLK